MATATLELVNPYSKLGLKRRPTYNEIINLIDENETITGNLPDRTATFYKASPEGSFFDGTDAMELLKEQQNRIFQRQMQDLLLRQNVRANGGTFHLQRHLQSANTTEAQPAEVQADRDMLSAQVQADLLRRQQQLQDRQQQTGEAHRQEISRQGVMPTLQSFLSGATSPIRNIRQVEHFDLTRDNPETFRSVSSSSSSSDSQGPRRQRRTEPSSSSTRRPLPDDSLTEIPPQARRKNRK